MAAPSAPIIDPILAGPKHNVMAQSRADNSDDEDQSDPGSESSGSEIDQGPVLISFRILGN